MYLFAENARSAATFHNAEQALFGYAYDNFMMSHSVCFRWHGTAQRSIILSKLPLEAGYSYFHSCY